MKKILLGGLSIFSITVAIAQQKEGKVIYQRSLQMMIEVSNAPGTEDRIPRTRTDKFEMNFANNQMSLKQMEDDVQEEMSSGNGGVMIRTMGASPDDMTYCDFEKARKVEAREFFDKRYLVGDSIRRNNWKLSDETKKILGHECRKATTQRVGKRMMMNMDNGKMERKEVDDTSTIIAWFTSDIPVPAGPDLQGQLPGMILELDMNNGRTVYTALDISAKPDLSSIKEPTKGKKVTPDEFNKERNKMLDEMQKNNQGGNFRVRVN